MTQARELQMRHIEMLTGSAGGVNGKSSRLSGGKNPDDLSHTVHLHFFELAVSEFEFFEE
jgi:hypothetical protein